MQKEATDFLHQFVKLITDFFFAIWEFSMNQFTILFSHSWTALPVWKVIVVVIFVAVVIFFLWEYAAAFVRRLVQLLVAFAYMLPGVFALGVAVWLVNLFVHDVHIAALDKLVLF